VSLVSTLVEKITEIDPEAVVAGQFKAPT